MPNTRANANDENGYEALEDQGRSEERAAISKTQRVR